MKAKVTWKQRMSFTGTGESGFEVPLGTDAGVGGDEDGFRPMELFATALAGCTAMDVISILRKKSQDVTAFEVQVHAARAEEHPRVFIRAMIEYFITGHAVEAAAVVRAIELSATRYCPAQAMFAKVFPMDLKYHIYEQDANGGTKLVKSGVYSVPSRIEAG